MTHIKHHILLMSCFLSGRVNKASHFIYASIDCREVINGNIRLVQLFLSVRTACPRVVKINNLLMSDIKITIKEIKCLYFMRNNKILILK